MATGRVRTGTSLDIYGLLLVRSASPSDSWAFVVYTYNPDLTPQMEGQADRQRLWFGRFCETACVPESRVFKKELMSFCNMNYKRLRGVTIRCLATRQHCDICTAIFQTAFENSENVSLIQTPFSTILM